GEPALVVAHVGVIEAGVAFQDRLAAHVSLPGQRHPQQRVKTPPPPAHAAPLPPRAAPSRLPLARLAQSAIVQFTWSSVKRSIFAAATAGPKMPNTGPAWNPRAIIVGMKSAARRSI